MTDRELMQQALDALESGLTINDRDSLRWTKAIEALRAALANEFNPDWDAMAVMVEEQQRMAKRIEELKERLLQVELKPSTARLAQQEQEPVAWRNTETGEFCTGGFLRNQIERWQPLYTAPPQPKTEQEPVAWELNEVILNSIHDSSEVVAQPQREWCQCKDAPNDCTYEKNCRVPQIDAAFKRIEWQGLTDEEITETLKRFGLGERAALARAIEAKLKEKNG